MNVITTKLTADFTAVVHIKLQLQVGKFNLFFPNYIDYYT